MSGIKLSKATCLGYIDRLCDALEPWESAAKKHLTRSALHADETGFRVNKKTQSLYVITDGSLTLIKFLHRKRGKESVESFGIIPVYTVVLIHDCWASYFAYTQCKHQVCGAYLHRKLTFVVESNGYRWARLLQKLLCEICGEINMSETGALSEAECRKYRKRYRIILTQGDKEMPEIPQWWESKRVRMHTTCSSVR